MRALVLLLALVVCGCGGSNVTEVVVGVATDLPTPSRLDTVTLSAARNGVVLFLGTWDLRTGTALPGTVGMSTTKAGPTQIDLSLIGFVGPSPLVTRSAVVTLDPKRTLFYRMALEGRCANFSCAAGQSCIDGVCRDSAVAGTTLPPYVPGIERAMSCNSGSTLIDTASGQPLAMSAAGCASDERCEEGICYKVAGKRFGGGESGGTITGTLPPGLAAID